MNNSCYQQKVLLPYNKININQQMPQQIPSCSSCTQHQSTLEQIAPKPVNWRRKAMMGTASMTQNSENPKQSDFTDSGDATLSCEARIPQKTNFSALPAAIPIFRPSILPSVNLVALLATLNMLLLASTPAMGQTSSKCYAFAPGLTIPGADYRRDFGLSRRECAEVCKTDACCMAFEWRRIGGQCTLKSRSLNGTVVKLEQLEDEVGLLDELPQKNAASDVFFALCLDLDDSERNRFWDHELGGPVVASADNIEREKCAQFCGEYTAAGAAEKRASKKEQLEETNETKGFFTGRRRGKRPAHRKSETVSSSSAPAVIYNWHTQNPMDMEAPLGQCQCISVLQHIRLSFGSFAGFLI